MQVLKRPGLEVMHTTLFTFHSLELVNSLTSLKLNADSVDKNLGFSYPYIVYCSERDRHLPVLKQCSFQPICWPHS